MLTRRMVAASRELKAAAQGEPHPSDVMDQDEAFLVILVNLMSLSVIMTLGSCLCLSLKLNSQSLSPLQELMVALRLGETENVHRLSSGSLSLAAQACPPSRLLDLADETAGAEGVVCSSHSCTHPQPAWQLTDPIYFFSPLLIFSWPVPRPEDQQAVQIPCT